MPIVTAPLEATITIAVSTSLSAAVKLSTGRIFAFQIPATWTAANLTFQANYDGGTTFYDMYDDAGTEVTVTVGGASRFIQVSNPMAWFGVQYLKVRSGTTGTPVAQAADRVIGLVTEV